MQCVRSVCSVHSARVGIHEIRSGRGRVLALFTGFLSWAGECRLVRCISQCRVGLGRDCVLRNITRDACLVTMSLKDRIDPERRGSMNRERVGARSAKKVVKGYGQTLRVDKDSSCQRLRTTSCSTKMVRLLLRPKIHRLRHGSSGPQR